jgi:CelD/BcsL family acetyltransferase involved in cellulose biosynthesis
MTRHEVAHPLAAAAHRLSPDSPCRVRVYADLAAVPAGGAALFANGAKDSLFLSQPWFANLAATVAAGRHRPRFYAAEPAAPGGPEALLPMMVAADAPRVLTGLAAPYTCLFAPLVGGAGAPGAALAALAAAIRDEHPAWSMVRFDFIPRDWPLYDALAASLRGAGYAVGTYFNFGNWFEPIAAPSIDAYLAARPSVMRNTLKRKAKKLEKLGNSRFDMITGGAALDAGLAAYEKIYAASWKEPEAYPQFIPGLMRTCAAAGWLRLGVIYVGDEPAAAQFWIVAHGKATIYKLAYDERFEALSVGSILTLKMAQHAIEIDRVSEIDYGSGDDAYKKDWMSQRRELWGIVAFNPRTIAGLAGIARHWGGRALARLRQRAGR